MGSKCWAREYSECDGPISKEHILSACSQIGKTITLSPPFSDAERTVGVNSVTAKVLCRFHNSKLGDSLDEYSGSAMKKIFMMHSTTEHEFPGAELIDSNHYRLMIDGIKLERWFCKTLANITASNLTLLPGMPPFHQPPPLALVKHIFGGTNPLPPPFGLYGAAPWVNLFPKTKSSAQHLRVITLPVKHHSSITKRWHEFTIPKLLLYRNATANFILNIGCVGGANEIIQILRDHHKIEIENNNLEYQPIAQKMHIRHTTRTLCYLWPDSRKKPKECCT